MCNSPRERVGCSRRQQTHRRLRAAQAAGDFTQGTIPPGGQDEGLPIRRGRGG